MNKLIITLGIAKCVANIFKAKIKDEEDIRGRNKAKILKTPHAMG